MYVLEQVYLGSGITQHCKKGNKGLKDTANLRLTHLHMQKRG